MDLETVLFWLFAGLTLAGGVSVVVSRNPVHAAMGLVGAFFALAGLYLLLLAQLLAALQILVYAGAIMVLFLFVIMLLNLSPKELGERRVGPFKIVGGLTAAGLTALLVGLLAPLRPAAHTPVSDFGTVAAVGRLIFNEYTLPFEATSLLLLAAMVGAVVVAKGKI